MAVEVELTDEFGAWWDRLELDEQETVGASVRLLEMKGIALGHPYCSGVHGSRHGHMRELRIQHQGRPYRVFYAFDPRRTAILLIGGDKTGAGKVWYDSYIRHADKLYDNHLKEIADDAASEGKDGP